MKDEQMDFDLICKFVNLNLEVEVDLPLSCRVESIRNMIDDELRCLRSRSSCFEFCQRSAQWLLHAR